MGRYCDIAPRAEAEGWGYWDIAPREKPRGGVKNKKSFVFTWKTKDFSYVAREGLEPPTHGL